MTAAARAAGVILQVLLVLAGAVGTYAVAVYGL